MSAVSTAAGSEGAGGSKTAGLTDEQERAVARRTGSLLLAAGAGSGKTAVLIERFVRAIEQDRIAPGRILAITFTERAAAELRDRLRARLLELDAREAAQAAEAAFVSTFHGFCARLLSAHALQAGLEPDFRVLDETFASRLRFDAFEQALADLISSGQEALDLVAACGADRLRAMALDAHAQLRSQGHADPRLPRADANPTAALLDRLLGAFARRYEQCKREREAVDFDDLELRARDLLLCDAELRRSWSERFELLMVDEFQDSNRRQLQILAALDRDNLFTVGDQLQSIYSFRHAEVSLFREREERLAPAQASLALTRNFRSRPAILTAVERVFAGRMGNRFAPLRRTRRAGGEPSVELLLSDKRGWEPASQPVSERPTSAPATAAPWRLAEARLLAERVHELTAGGAADPGEIVVLLRALGDLPLFEGALRARGVPTAAATGAFWDNQQVADLLAWLRALANPLDEPALYSALASPLVGVSSDGLALIAARARRDGRGVWRTIGERAAELEAALTEPDRSRLASFRECFCAERAAFSTRPIAELLVRAIAASGYEDYVLARDEPERRLASVRKLLRLARSFEAQEGRDLRGFLDHVLHARIGAEGREPEPDGDGRTAAVRLLSVHAAKGLEFAVVCLCDLGREPNLRQPDLLVDAEGGRLGVRLASIDSPEPACELDYEELREERRAAQEEEEDRILYVACTRARERLILSGAAAFERWPQPKAGSPPIDWLAPALVPEIAELAVRAQRESEPVTVAAGNGLSVRCLFNRPGPDQPSGADDPADGGGSTVGCGPPARLTRTPRRSAPGLSLRRPHTDPDPTVSSSSLVELERCGYRYYLERVLGLPERHDPASDRLDDRRRETIVHALLEHVDFARPRLPRGRDVEEAARRLGAGLAKRECDEIVELLARALASEPAALLRELGGVRRKHPFAFSPAAGEPLVTGWLDLLVERSDSSVLIVDYKSDRLAAGEDVELLAQRNYATQRSLYALAAIEAGAAEVEVAHWFLARPERWASARFRADRREQLRAELLDRLAAARGRGFAVSDDPRRDLCLFCPGRSGLCSWEEARTMRA